MQDDHPSIAIIGAGPVGIEAALYARFLGYPVTVYEQGEVGEHVSQWGHVQLFSPFRMNSSSLGLAALAAQQPDRQLPAPGQLHTGRQWIEEYLQPLANSDLVRPCIRTRTRVTAVSRDTSGIDVQGHRGDLPFLLQVEESGGTRRIDAADIVIDASGTWGQANPLGPGGMPACGEQALRAESIPESNLFQRRIPDLHDFQPRPGATFVVVGRGYSAATNIVQLGRLQQREPSIRCIWLTRGTAAGEGPVTVIENDPLPSRSALASEANSMARQQSWLEWRPGTEIREIRLHDGRFQLALSDGQSLTADHVLANTGFRGDFGMLDALQVHRCYVSGGPMAWAASMSKTSQDCLQHSSPGPDAVRTSEPGFFVIGSKSCGTDPRFLFAVGLQQVRDIFRIISERDTLDLYATMQPASATG
jgi:hypothetical protein